MQRHDRPSFDLKIWVSRYINLSTNTVIYSYSCAQDAFDFLLPHKHVNIYIGLLMLFLILLHIDCPVEGPVSPRNFQKLAPHFHFSLLPLGELSTPLDSVFSCQVPPNHFHHVLEGPVPPRDFQELAPHFLFFFSGVFPRFSICFLLLLHWTRFDNWRNQSPQGISRDWLLTIGNHVLTSVAQ